MRDFTAPLSALVEPVREMVFTGKDRSLPYVGLEHLKSDRSRVALTGVSDDSISMNVAFRPGDILLGKLRPNLHKSVMVDFPGYCSTELIVLRPRLTVDPSYAGWMLRSEKVFAEAVRTAEGTRMPRTSWSRLRNLEIWCPPPAEQQRIAEILDELDHAIEACNHVLEKLGTAQVALLRSILIDIQAPSRPLADLLSVNPRNGYSPKEVEGWTGVLALGLGCLTVSGFSPRQLKNVPASDDRYWGAWLSDGDLLMSRSNTLEMVGLVGRYRDVGVPCIYPDLMMKLVPNSLVRPEFLEISLSDANARRQIKSLAQGTSGSMVKISADTARRLQVRVPSLPEQDRILRAAAMAKSEIAAKGHEKNKLVQLKRGLMEDLLSGRVRVPR
jgi:type I restriction enzyme, S subunit